MVMINRATKEITFKIVYYGPGLCGKTTDLEYIYSSANPERKGKLLTVATETDRTLFFDFMPLELGTIRGMKVRVQLYTVPGQVFYDATRRIVLRGSDGVVFVADSQAIMMDANLESAENLRNNLKLNSLDPESIPLVFQYNKQDLKDLSPVEDLEERLNWRKVPHFLSVATIGTGCHDTLRKITEMVIRKLQGQAEADRGGAQAKAQEAPPAPEPTRLSRPVLAPGPAPEEVPAVGEVEPADAAPIRPLVSPSEITATEEPGRQPEAAGVAVDSGSLRRPPVEDSGSRRTVGGAASVKVVPVQTMEEDEEPAELAPLPISQQAAPPPSPPAPPEVEVELESEPASSLDRDIEPAAQAESQAPSAGSGGRLPSQALADIRVRLQYFTDRLQSLCDEAEEIKSAIDDLESAHARMTRGARPAESPPRLWYG